MTDKTEIEARNITVFGSETEFEGKLSFTDDLVINGSFNGTIDATGNLTVGENSKCVADTISVDSAVIFGNVNANIIAKDRVEMCSGSVVRGEVTTARIRIAKNVEFDGDVTMVDKMPETDLFATASKEFKDSFVLYSPLPGN